MDNTNNTHQTQEEQQVQSQLNDQAPQSEELVIEQNQEDCIEKSSEKCLKCKNSAAVLFQQNQFFEAIDLYSQALEYCPLDDKQMLCILNSNIAVCYQKLENYDETITYATHALEHNPTFVKAIINRAVSYEKNDKLDEALEDYKKLLEIQPTDAYTRQKVSQLQVKVDQLNEKRKAEVLGGLKDLGNTILGKFGMSLDNFKLQQNDNGSYNVQFKQ